MSDRRPARVRILSESRSEAAQAAPGASADAPADAPVPTTPQRRRTDPGYQGKVSGSMGVVLLAVLFVVGAAAGGALSVAFNLVEMPIR